MYGLPVLYGNKDNAFPDINSAVITERIAQKLFGRKDVLNRRFSMQSTVAGTYQDYTVSAVLKDIPVNSVTGLIGVNYNIFVPTIGSRFYPMGDPAQSWNGAYEIGAIKLRAGVRPEALQKPFQQLLAKYAPDDFKKNLTVVLAPVRDYYLKDNNGAVQKMITTLSLAAAFILLMAMINFVNITIGTSAHRLKEIGLRKVLGGLRKQIILQFLTEACLLSGISAILAAGLYELLRPAFTGILHTVLPPFWHFDSLKIIFIVLLTLLTGLLSGIYPAFVLSSTDLVHAVKGKINAARGGYLLRRGLLVVQFTLAILVFISALNVSRQIRYIFHKDLGYDKEQVLVIDAYPKQWDSVGVMKMQHIRDGLLQLPVVKDATLAFEVPDRKAPITTDLLPVNKDNAPLHIPTIFADEHYAATYGLQVREGTFFSQSGAYIPNQIVLNESAARALGLSPETAIGRQIRIPSTKATVTIAGIVRDFHFASLRQQIEPTVFLHIGDVLSYRYLSLKLKSPDMAKAVDDVRAKWKALVPSAPFEYSFMDDRFQSLYQAELQLQQTADLATILNLVIVMLGIFGVVAFTLAARNKEVAIRKVLGASIRNIITLFGKEYVRPILLANAIAWPLAYLLTDSWLKGYSYRITQNAYPYLFVAGFIFVITLLLVAAQCYRTASSNPVKDLRSE
jgi:ABC-type antimicrobial peptide transport system permease subunit